jgi:hypothetical protein
MAKLSSGEPFSDHAQRAGVFRVGGHCGSHGLGGGRICDLFTLKCALEARTEPFTRSIWSSLREDPSASWAAARLERPRMEAG